MNALDKLLIMQPAVASKPDAPPLLLTAGRIAFDNVTFAYTDGQQLLRGVSFAVEPGQTMAIVGGSGSGKSTVLRLLYRFYDVHDGAITVDGQDLREVELALALTPSPGTARALTPTLALALALSLALSLTLALPYPPNPMPRHHG